MTGQGTMSVQEAVLTSHSSLQLIILTTHRSMDMRRHMSKGTKNMLFVINTFSQVLQAAMLSS